MRLTSTARAAVALFVTSVSPATGQIRGVVIDQTGSPIIGATVSLWQGAIEIATTSSGPRGNFVLASRSVDRADGIAFRAIGFRPQTRKWSPADSVLQITLEVFAGALPDIVVSGLKIDCPRSDNSLARRLWTAVRKKYDLTPQGVGLLVRMNSISETAYASELGMIDEQRLANSQGAAGLFGATRLHGYSVLLDSGYAVSRRGFKGAIPASIDGAYFEWWYPSFHRWQPDHFLEDAFGILQFFDLASSGETSPSIRFCSRDHRRPYVAGVLMLNPDTTVSEAAWEFHTPPPSENAGGHAWYLATSTSKGMPHYLLPNTAVFWRKRGAQRGLYFHDSAIYHGWFFGSDAEIPRTSPP